MLRQLALITLATIIIDIAQCVSDGDNTQTLLLLCPALHLADGDISFDPQPVAAPLDASELYQLNATLADTAWKEKLTQKDGEQNYKAQELPKDNTNQEWAQKWETWTTAAVAVAKKEAADKILDKFGLSKATQEQLHAIRHTIAAYSDGTFDVLAAPEPQAPAEDAVLAKQIKRAVYGDEGGFKDGLKGEAVHGGNAGGYAAVCAGNKGTQNPIKTIAVTVACVCGTANGKTGTEPCAAKGGGDVAWQASALPSRQQWEVIRRHCPAIAKNIITADRLRRAVDTATAAIYGVNTELWVGKHDATNCDGDNNGSCIKYTNAAASGTPDLKQAEWISKLTNVADALDARRRAIDAKTSNKEIQLKQLLALAKAAAKQASQLSSVARGITPTKQALQEEAEPRTLDCTKIANIQECKPEVGCKYNATSKACENDPKPAVSKTNQETAGENVGVKCSEKKK